MSRLPPPIPPRIPTTAYPAGPYQHVQVVIPQKRTNSAATASLVFGVLALLTCFIPIVPWILGAIGLLFAALGFLVGVFRGGTGIVFCLAGGILSAIPLAPVILVGGLLVHNASSIVRDARKRARLKQEEVTAVPSPPPLKAHVGPEYAPPTKPLVKTAALPTPKSTAPAASFWHDNVRTWTAISGHTVTAEFRGATAGKVKLRKPDGTDISVPLDQLSEEDQKWIRDRSR